MLHCATWGEMTTRTASNRKAQTAQPAAFTPPVSSQSKDARAVRSGLALREALLTLLERKSFDQITVRDICAEAGVHYATFFRHHPTKESLLDIIARDQIAMLSNLAMAIRGGADYHAGFRAMCSYVDDHRDLWSTLLNGGAGAAMREEWVRQASQVAEHEPAANDWLPKGLGTIVSSTIIAETLAWWVAQPRGKVSVDDISTILMRLLGTHIGA